MNEEDERLLAEREAGAEELARLADEANAVATRLERANAAAALDESAAEMERSARRHEQREAAQKLREGADELEHAATRMERATAAAKLGDLADETEELVLSLEESEKLAAQAMAFRASLPETNPESGKFSVASIKDMTYDELLAERDKRILADWDRVLKDPPEINGRKYDDIVNTADYETELAGKRRFRYEATVDASDFQLKMLEMYHGGLMFAGEDDSYRYTRRIHGGPLFEYIGNCEELKELKAFLLELYAFWKKHSKYGHCIFPSAFCSCVNCRHSPVLLPQYTHSQTLPRCPCRDLVHL